MFAERYLIITYLFQNKTSKRTMLRIYLPVKLADRIMSIKKGKSFNLPNGAITKFKKSVGWTIDRVLLGISLVINEGILTFSY